MNRNQKLALGCGGAGCLGLILVVIIVVILGAAGYISLPGFGSNRNYNYNSNSNRNSNYNSSYNGNSNTSSETSSSMSDDAKHKLYQAAGMSKDTALVQRVLRKLNLLDGDAHQAFVKEHFSWAMKNLSFIQSVNTPEKARAYVNDHIDD